MASPKAIYSFNGPLMWFVLYLPVSPNVLLDSDEAELFICSSWSWCRRALTHLGAKQPACLPVLHADLLRLQSQEFSMKVSNQAACWLVESYLLSVVLLSLFPSFSWQLRTFLWVSFNSCNILIDWYFITPVASAGFSDWSWSVQTVGFAKFLMGLNWV